MGNTETELRHFAVRRVNPFEGVLQVIESKQARAYSRDGRIWQIQVLAQRPDHTWRSFSDVPPVEQFFNYALWDKGNGLHRVLANPVMDIGSMNAAGHELAALMPTLLDLLPFPLIDRYEYWETDFRGEPVALLATTENPALMANMCPGRWQAARLADHGFVSSSLLARGVPASSDLGPRQHAEQLERQVRQLGQHKTWFHRHEDGTGERLGPTHDPARDRLKTLPPLGLKTDWKNPEERALVDDYLAWQAPRLLTLQEINDTQRAWLERHACRQALELAAVFRLIPRILDHDRIEAARVEAALRQAAG